MWLHGVTRAIVVVAHVICVCVWREGASRRGNTSVAYEKGVACVPRVGVLTVVVVCDALFGHGD